MGICIFINCLVNNAFADAALGTIYNSKPSAPPSNASKTIMDKVNENTPSYKAGSTTDTSSHKSDYPTLNNKNTTNSKTPAPTLTNSDYDGITIQYDENTPLDQQVVLITDFGAVVIKLNTKEDPQSVAEFIKLIKQNYYKNTTFYRLFDNYFIQGGDPLENGTGNAGVPFPDETKSTDKFFAGTVALARSHSVSNKTNKSSSQFFITFVRTPWLDSKYTIIGEVVSGLGNLSTFFGKYSTNANGIMQNTIPYDIYLLSDYRTKFPDQVQHMKAIKYVPPSEKVSIFDTILQQEQQNQQVDTTHPLDIITSVFNAYNNSYILVPNLSDISSFTTPTTNITDTAGSSIAKQQTAKTKSLLNDINTITKDITGNNKNLPLPDATPNTSPNAQGTVGSTNTPANSNTSQDNYNQTANTTTTNNPNTSQAPANENLSTETETPNSGMTNNNATGTVSADTGETLGTDETSTPVEETSQSTQDGTTPSTQPNNSITSSSEQPSPEANQTQTTYPPQ